jgi:hypothetical protein
MFSWNSKTAEPKEMEEILSDTITPQDLEVSINFIIILFFLRKKFSLQMNHQCWLAMIMKLTVNYFAEIRESLYEGAD